MLRSVLLGFTGALRRNAALSAQRWATSDAAGSAAPPPGDIFSTLLQRPVAAAPPEPVKEALDERIDDLLNAMTAEPENSNPLFSEALEQFEVERVTLPEDLKTGFRFGLSEAQLAGVSQFTRRIFSFENASQAEINKYRVGQAILRFQRAPNDTGSVEAQVAGLTERIRYLTTHMQTHKKDNSAKRGLMALVSRRRRLLQYLKREDYDRYKTLRLALRLRPI